MEWEKNLCKLYIGKRPCVENMQRITIAPVQKDKEPRLLNVAIWLAISVKNMCKWPMNTWDAPPHKWPCTCKLKPKQDTQLHIRSPSYIRRWITEHWGGCGETRSLVPRWRQGHMERPLWKTVRHRVTILYLKDTANKNRDTGLRKNLCTNVHSRIAHHGQNVKTLQMSIHWRVMPV